MIKNKPTNYCLLVECNDDHSAVDCIFEMRRSVAMRQNDAGPLDAPKALAQQFRSLSRLLNATTVLLRIWESSAPA